MSRGARVIYRCSAHRRWVCSSRARPYSRRTAGSGLGYLTRAPGAKRKKGNAGINAPDDFFFRASSALRPAGARARRVSLAPPARLPLANANVKPHARAHLPATTPRGRSSLPRAVLLPLPPLRLLRRRLLLVLGPPLLPPIPSTCLFRLFLFPRSRRVSSPRVFTEKLRVFGALSGAMAGCVRSEQQGNIPSGSWLARTYGSRFCLLVQRERNEFFVYLAEIRRDTFDLRFCLRSPLDGALFGRIAVGVVVLIIGGWRYLVISNLSTKMSLWRLAGNHFATSLQFLVLLGNCMQI